MPAALRLLHELDPDLYENATVPIVLAHRYTAIFAGTGRAGSRPAVATGIATGRGLGCGGTIQTITRRCAHITPSVELQRARHGHDALRTKRADPEQRSVLTCGGEPCVLGSELTLLPLCAHGRSTGRVYSRRRACAKGGTVVARMGKRTPRSRASRRRLLLVFGTRPEAIKISPVALALRTVSDRFETLLCSTGQHRELLDSALRPFGLVADIDLAVMQRRQHLADLAGRLLAGLDSVLERERPDMVLVQGDTTTAFVGALAAYYRKIPVAHIEAGLRTRDLSSPFPEEGIGA